MANSVVAMIYRVSFVTGTPLKFTNMEKFLAWKKVKVSELVPPKKVLNAEKTTN